jgi:hypothetical protein
VGYRTAYGTAVNIQYSHARYALFNSLLFNILPSLLLNKMGSGQPIAMALTADRCLLQTRVSLIAYCKPGYRILPIRHLPVFSLQIT